MQVLGKIPIYPLLKYYIAGSGFCQKKKNNHAGFLVLS